MLQEIIIAFLLMIITVVTAFVILSKRGLFIGKAKIGAGEFTFELEVRTEKRQITEKNLNMIDVTKFYIDSSIGFIIHKPFSEDWLCVETTKREFLREKGYSEDLINFLMQNIPYPDKNIKILTIRRGPIQSIQYTTQTMIDNRFPLNLSIVEKIFPKLEEKLYDQIVIHVINKTLANELPTLFDFFRIATQDAVVFGSKKVFVNSENTVFLLDCSANFKNIKYNGKLGDHILNNIILVQENMDNFFLVSVNYVQAPDKSTKVWDELREYLNSFRVLIK